jgi:Holliday junction resolvase
MPLNSRSKGQRAERQWRDQLRDAGYAAERGQQHAGTPDSPDVKCPDLPLIHFEVKAVERLNIHDALAQAIRDAGPQKVPVVAHKRNRGPWLITMRATDWFPLLQESHHPRSNPKS